jgi:hypothetical protein
MLAGTTDGRDELLGKVGSQRRYAAHLNAQTNATCESFLKTLKREEIYASAYRDFEDLQRGSNSSKNITTDAGCIQPCVIGPRKDSRTTLRAQNTRRFLGDR